VFGGPMVKRLFDSQAIYALVLAGILMLIAALVVRFVDDKDDMYKLRVKS
jgi:maltose/moltooligosaccharide transporter